MLFIVHVTICQEFFLSFIHAPRHFPHNPSRSLEGTAMDWNMAIERNREALKRILAALVAMAGGTAFTSPLWGGRREASGGGCALAITSTRRSDDRQPPHKGEVKSEFPATLPRHLHRAVLRLLRPAESAVRRLVIVAARNVVVPPPPPRSAWSPSPVNGGGSRSRRLHRFGSSAAKRGRGTAEGGGGGIATRPLTLPLFDRLPRWETRPRRPVANSVPRISVPGYTMRFSIPPPPSPTDPVDATRLGLRFAALAAALDDLPRQAKRFARWRARCDAIRAQERNPDAAVQSAHLPQVRRRPHRNWPLRPGRPPGWQRRSRDEIHEILKDLHGLAFDVLERPDTS
jgi:hypothetical protein